MRFTTASLVAGVLLATGCANQQTASSGSSAAVRPGEGVVEAVSMTGVAAPPASVSRQGTPPGTSVYTNSTYAQPAYSYPSSSPGFASDGPREPAPGGVSARTDQYQVTVRMDDGTRQIVTMARAPANGARVQISPDGRVAGR